MGILARLFSGSVRRQLEQMSSDADAIQMAVARKLFAAYVPQYGDDRGLTLAAAVANRLFAKTCPQHSADDLRLADELAADLVRRDDEVRYAALMSCRARLLVEADRNSDDAQRLWDHLQWMGTLAGLPTDDPAPNSIRQLAMALRDKYSGA